MGRKLIGAWGSPEAARAQLDRQLGAAVVGHIQGIARYVIFRLRIYDRVAAENQESRAARKALAAVPPRLRTSLRSAGLLSSPADLVQKVAFYGTADEFERLADAMGTYGRTGNVKPLEKALQVPTLENIRTKLIAMVWKLHPELRSPAVWAHIGIMLGIDEECDTWDEFHEGPRDAWRKALGRVSLRIKGEAPSINR